MKKKQEQGFTLVELIVVIVILVILSYIAFISLTGYGQKARDSVRLSDMTNIQKVLELSKVDVGYYPQPDDGVPVSYSGSTLWTQGYFGTGALREVRRISEVPTDPLSDEPYIYSVTYDGQEYQLAGAMEGGDALGFSPFVETSHAAFSRSIVRGNYNGAFIGKQISDYLYVFAVPSIVTKIYDDIETSLDVVDAVTEKRFIMNNFSAIAPSHQVEETDSAGTVDFTPTSAADVVVYQGTAQELGSYSGALSVAQKIDTLYSGSELESDETIGNLTSADTSNSSLSDAIVYDIGQRLSGVRSISSYIDDIIGQTMEDVGKRIESSLTSSSTDETSEGESEGGGEEGSSFLSCVNPFGGTIEDGATITAYQTESVAFGETCTSETRTCSDGALSGSFVYESCSVDAASACSLPWGGTIADSGTATAYQTESVAFGEVCAGETRTCSNGTLSGTYTFDTCSVDAAASCTLPWGGSIAHGATTTAYLESSGETCTSETRTCNNGTLSGNYVNQSCSVTDTTPDAFTFNDLTNQPHSTLLQSNTITVTGITTGVPITVTGEGSPDIRVFRSGSWNTLPLGATSGTVYNGDEVIIRMTSSDQLSDTYSALVTIGGTTDSFDVTTRDYYQGAHGTLVTWTGNSRTNIISTPASDAYNFFKLYDYSDANITFGNQDVTIDGYTGSRRNQTIVGGDGNNLIDLGRGVTSVTLGNGRNSITSGYGSTSTIQVGYGANTIVTGDNADASTIRLGGGNNMVTVNDFTDTFDIDEIAGNGNNTITIEGHNDTAGAINLNDGNNTVNLAGYGSLANITVGDGDNFINVSHYDAEATISLGTGTNQVDASGDLVTIYTGTAGSVEVVDPDTGNSTTVIWRGGSVNYTKFDAYSNSDKIDVSQLADITDWTDLQANHLQMNIPVGGFTILSSGGNFVVEDEYGSLDASDFIF